MKKILTILLSILSAFLLVTNISANDIKIIDDDNVLSDEEKTELEYLIENYIDYTNYDMVVYLADKGEEYFNTPGNSITTLADDTFDYNGYGIGIDREGIILCFDIKYRDYTITTSGPGCIETYSIAALDSVYNNVTPYFRENDFYGGIKAFISSAKLAYENYDSYHGPIEEDYTYVKPNKVKRAVTSALVGSTLITVLAFVILSTKLKSQRVGATASQYMKGSNLNIFRSGDVYLYSHVSRTRIERSNHNISNSHSSPVHISSSGHSHGGGGSHRV